MEAKIVTGRAAVVEVMAVVMAHDRAVVAGKANTRYLDYEPSYKFIRGLFR